jgi:hypothetical protein
MGFSGTSNKRYISLEYPLKHQRISKIRKIQAKAAFFRISNQKRLITQ